eukprot:scaffold23789_cov27-Cyclotella_meneghiniana.AAC.1
MMGWHEPKITMTCCELCILHNMVNTGPPTAGASSVTCKYHLCSSYNLESEGEMGAAAAAIDPSDQIVRLLLSFSQ